MLDILGEAPVLFQRGRVLITKVRRGGVLRGGLWWRGMLGRDSDAETNRKRAQYICVHCTGI